MPYFTPAFMKFFKELSKNNTTVWFNENRKTYEKEVKKPFSDFVEEMIRRIQKLDPEVQIKPADAIMRINKDIRFSKDKTPYNTYVAANISRFGKKDKSYPGFYFQLGPEGIGVFGGVYMVEDDKLLEIRNHIGDNLKAFAKAYSDSAFKSKFGTLKGEQNKRLPAEIQELVAKEPLIANKQFYFQASLKANLITSDELADTLMEYVKAAKKVNDFFKAVWE
ncbi:MAG: DUF2461 domain-containing protein [Bacteroidia bacterium]|jgi:uncharacterized protein (TIGR02453 family)